jgi:DNA-binding transcriptional ArsR family regulator
MPSSRTRACAVSSIAATHRSPDIFIPVQVLKDDGASELADMFRLLGDPTRVRILFVLSETDEMCVHELAAAVEASETKVSQALRLLRTAGAVRNRRDGRHIHYRLHDDHVRTLLEVSRDHVSHGAETRSDS